MFLFCFPVSSEFGNCILRFAYQKDSSGCSVEDGFKKGTLKAERAVWKLLQETLQRIMRTCIEIQQEGWKGYLNIQKYAFFNFANLEEKYK